MWIREGYRKCGKRMHENWYERIFNKMEIVGGGLRESEVNMATSGNKKKQNKNGINNKTFF